MLELREKSVILARGLWVPAGPGMPAVTRVSRNCRREGAGTQSTRPGRVRISSTVHGGASEIRRISCHLVISGGPSRAPARLWNNSAMMTSCRNLHLRLGGHRPVLWSCGRSWGGLGPRRSDCDVCTLHRAAVLTPPSCGHAHLGGTLATAFILKQGGKLKSVSLSPVLFPCSLLEKLLKSSSSF